jgi:DASS family divalent anion:Na+ symporter
MSNEIPAVAVPKEKGAFAQIFARYKTVFLFSFLFLAGALIWNSPRPVGVTSEAWHLFALFVATIIGVILKPLPMGAMALLAIMVSVASGTLTFEQAFSGFSNDIVWLIVMAFFIAKGFVVTGLGSRVAYYCVSFLGKSTLGLGYGIMATDLLLAPTIPSVTARTGGVIFPIVKSLAKAFGSEPLDPSSRKIGSFLVKVAFQGSAITSAMFLTSMAGNPLIAQLAKETGIVLSWERWALAAIVPGLVSLLIVPYLIYKLYPPEIKKTPHAKAFAQQKLQELGKVKFQEWIMLATFGLLLLLWIGGTYIGMKAAVAALIGLVVLILTGVLKWNDILEEKAAWDTLFWFAALVTMASFLNKFGLTTWFGNYVVSHIEGYNWIFGFGILSIFYFYSHYFFASNVAHIGAMYAPFLIVAVALGTPPELAALILAFFSSLFGGISHYGSGPAPILFGSGYVSIGTWWKLGGVLSVINIVIWIVVGGLWWKLLGLW